MDTKKSKTTREKLLRFKELHRLNNDQLAAMIPKPGGGSYTFWTIGRFLRDDREQKWTTFCAAVDNAFHTDDAGEIVAKK